MRNCGAVVGLMLVLSSGAALSQTLTVNAVSSNGLPRSEFLTEGYSGAVALVAGANINSQEQAETADDLRLLQTGICYNLVGVPRSRNGRLYLAISQAATNTTYQNAFIAAQVIRFVPSSASGSDVAVSRNDGPWVRIKGNKPAPSPGADWKPLGKTAEEFADAHTLRDGRFQDTKIDALFANTKDGRNVRWHARLPRKLSASRIDGYYSSLDPALEPVWSGLMSEFRPPSQTNYRRLVRSYLISLNFGARSGRPIVFVTDPLDAEVVVVRIQSAPGSNLSTDHTFGFGLTSKGCSFLAASSGGRFSFRFW